MHTWVTDIFICNENCAVRISKALAWGIKCSDFPNQPLYLLEDVLSNNTHFFTPSLSLCFPSREYRCPLFEICRITLKCCSFIFVHLMSLHLGNFSYFPGNVLKSSWFIHISDLILKCYICAFFFSLCCILRCIIKTHEGSYYRMYINTFTNVSQLSDCTFLLRKLSLYVSICVFSSVPSGHTKE